MMAWIEGTARIAAGLAIGMGLAAACNVEPGSNPQFAPHCGDASGDATCVQSHRNKPFCSLCVALEDDQGCVASPPVPACRPGGGTNPGDGGDTMDMDTTDGMDTEMSTTSGTDTGVSTVAVDETGTSGTDTETFVPCEAEGELDPTCEELDASAPFCFEGACADCMVAGGDAFCGGLSVETPACDATAGTCIPCYAADRPVCGAASPICDDDLGACMPCRSHADCGGTACHLSPEDPLVGACFTDEEVVWVDITASCPGNGTEANPYCSLEDTLDELDDEDQMVINLVGGDPYDEDLVLTNAATLAIRGVGSPSLVSAAGGITPTLRVGGGAIVYLSNLRVINNEQGPGIQCDGAVVSMNNVVVADNGRRGLTGLSPCTIEMTRTRVHHNLQGGLRLLGGHLVLDNATIGENGNGSAGPGIHLVAATIDAVYATVAGNDGIGADSLQCDGEVSGTVRNSIFDGVDNESIDLDCFMIEYDNNALHSSSFGQGTNIETDGYDSFYFNDPDDGDFRLSAPPLTPYGGVAQWEEGDPRQDADGTDRPTDDLGYAGIDEP